MLGPLKSETRTFVCVCVCVDGGEARPCVTLQRCVQRSLEELSKWITLTGLTAAWPGLTEATKNAERWLKSLRAEERRMEPMSHERKE